ncbi:b(0,+)-type amino acid transporter 1-like [Mytilus galloprovincialis]
MAVYLSINVGYFAVLPKQEILSSDAVAVLWGKRILGVMQWIMPMFVICSCFGSANGSLFSSGRLSYVAARDGHLPSGISFLHVQRHTPIPSMIFTLTLSTLLIIPFDLGALIGIFSFTSWLFYGVSAATVLLLRYRNRHKKLDSYKVPLFIPIVVILLSTFLVLVPLIYLPKPEYKYVVLFMAVGLCIYFLFVYRKIKVPFVDSATRLMQKLLVVVPPSQEKSY